jgi:hypothetical protein
MWHPGMHANMNFPALLAMAGIGAAFVGTILAFAVVILSLVTRQRKIARITLRLFAACAAAYTLLLIGFSLGSRADVLAQGAEKYFCEIDCHLAYSVVGVKQQPAPGGTRYFVAVRTRFDETTISARRPRDLPLRPSPRTVQLIDSLGRRYNPESSSGTPLSTSLIPGQSYVTELSFLVPQNAQGVQLLIGTTSSWPDKVVVGDENSWLHKKTYFVI